MRLGYFRYAAAAAAGIAFASPSQALVVSGWSSEYGVGAEANALKFQLTVTMMPNAYGAAPNPFELESHAGTVKFADPYIGYLTADALAGTVRSNVDGLAGPRMAEAISTVSGLNLQLGHLAEDPPLLALTADAVASQSRVEGDWGALAFVGSTRLENLRLSVLGEEIRVSERTDPNTMAYFGAGIQVMINEQAIGGNGVDGRAGVTNALHIRLQNVTSGALSISGDIVIGHSDAALTAVPEPSTAAATLAGLACIAIGRRRRRT